ncbi:hypothetical protein CO180_03825 [candidate division WWE3 bacterium CG_4_9_14_3_um_filter_41_6]|uniref:Uncharacterized protein n=1 Tax=candidate division WWE3 bacterium CG_4_10_14_0_2_um_filter_41_14 TaxID=1975072 RepID=A0A2M7TIB3_UNCKA|nr:MAG: hypothetical protein COY32_04005 [candidate division WWE3 bacterium CG_4_10_14_0_2_um_filter_41_14]PJA38319.1 MAG: hypothetical protein CO180_03825 [candidate division WWE3 bacterium CG_4_9_14_3_um_filter_41_6]
MSDQRVQTSNVAERNGRARADDQMTETRAFRRVLSSERKVLVKRLHTDGLTRDEKDSLLIIENRLCAVRKAFLTKQPLVIYCQHHDFPGDNHVIPWGRLAILPAAAFCVTHSETKGIKRRWNRVW